MTRSTNRAMSNEGMSVPDRFWMDDPERWASSSLWVPSSSASPRAAGRGDEPGDAATRGTPSSLNRAAAMTDGMYEAPHDRAEDAFADSLVIDGYYTYGVPPSSAAGHGIGSVTMRDYRIAEEEVERPVLGVRGGSRREGMEGISMGTAAAAATSPPGSRDHPPSAANRDIIMLAIAEDAEASPSGPEGDFWAEPSVSDGVRESHRGRGGDILPDAEVTTTSRPAPIPDEPMPMACGVPVARPVPGQGDPEPADEEEPPLAEGDLPGSHLGFLGRDVAVATKVNEEGSNDEEANYERCPSADAADSEAGCPSADAGDSEAASSAEADDSENSEAGIESRSHFGDEGDETGDRRSEDPRGSIRKLWGIVASAIVVSGAAGFFLGKRENGSLAPLAGFDPLPAPSLPFVPRSEQHGVILQLLDPLLQETGYLALNAEGSPQYRAVEWLVSTSFGAHDSFTLSPLVDQLDVGGGSAPPEDLRERLIQRYALAVLYFSTGGTDEEDEGEAGWSDSCLFLSDRHECEWRSASRPDVGLSCNDGDHEWRVGAIHLADNGLQGTLPDELGGLSDLRVIDTSKNPGVGGSLPAGLGSLSRLRVLLLEDMSLEGTFPPGYGGLASLEELILAGNWLTGSVPSEVRSMKSLTNVMMNQNLFTDGMSNFCEGDFAVKVFYSDCFCRNFPSMDAAVECTCCTVCCAEELGTEQCHTNIPCE